MHCRFQTTNLHKGDIREKLAKLSEHQPRGDNECSCLSLCDTGLFAGSQSKPNTGEPMNPIASAYVRWGYLLAMGAFLAVMLQSDSRDVRLYASIGLILFAQLREISLLSEVQPVKLKEKSPAPVFSPEKAPAPASSFEGARRSYAAGIIERMKGGSGTTA